MRIVFLKAPLRQFLRWSQRLLLAGAAGLLAYCGFVLSDAWVFQRRERGELEQMLRNRQQANGGIVQVARQTPSGIPILAASSGLIGRLEISRLGLSAMIIEGTSGKTLRRAVGHIAGTALPGQPGNVGISGHRDTFFRPLRNIRQDDVITLTTLLGEYRYRVVSTRIVGPKDVAVLDPAGSEVLTLVTCYPFYFVGAAPDRFIVRAERIV